MALTHNSTTKDSEPEWGPYIGANRAKLPDNAFADEKDRAFPHHWVENGKEGKDGRFESGDMYLHKGGLNAAWSAANGARSGQEASQAVKDHLQAHRKALGLDKDDKKEGSLMEPEKEKKVEVTAESLAAAYPGLIEQIKLGARADGIKEGTSAGAEAERQRIAALKGASVAGHEAILTECIADGRSTVADYEHRVVEAERARRNEARVDLTAEAIRPLKQVDGLEAEAKAKGMVAGPLDDVVAGMGDVAVEFNAEAFAKRVGGSATQMKAMETQCKAVWDSKPEIRAEFGNQFALYASYCAADKLGYCKVLSFKERRA